MAERLKRVSTEPEKLAAFVANNLRVTFELPFEIIPNHFLRRAAPDEVGFLQALLGNWGWADLSFAYESRRSRGRKDELWRSNDPKTWRYWVVGVTGGHEDSRPTGLSAMDQAEWESRGLVEIERAARLTSTELRFNLKYSATAPTRELATWRLEDWLFGNSAVPARFDRPAVDQISDLHRKMSTASREIRRAVELYHELSAIPARQPLYIIGLFAVIEALLTHDSGSDDSPSLSHQIRNKMNLVNRLLTPPLDCSCFGKCDFTALWSKLYSLRSTIAHGSDIDFSGKFQVLKSAETVRSFLDNAVKSLLRFSLDRSQLVLDLRAC